MGWFITQSLAFIIIAALIGLAIGIWIGWLVWGRRAKGKHAAAKAEAAARADAVAQPVPALAVAASGTGTTTEAEPVATSGSDAATSEAAGAEPAADTVPPVADGAPGPDPDGTDRADAGEAEAARADVIAEAEAVARRAAEADATATATAGSGAEAEASAAETAEIAETAETAAVPDDLRRIEGVGPKIAAALVAAGYPTYARIAAATEDELREAVAGQGIKFAPSAASWADQAQYLVDSDTKGLDEYQDYLVGGQERRGKFTENVDYTDVDEIDGAAAKAAAIAADEAEAAAAVEAEPEPEPQDLRRIEGIGPKIDATLKAAGYTTYAKVAGASETELREALAAGGIKFAPAATSWADQAQYLVDSDTKGLDEYQDYLVGGQDRAARFKKDVDYTDVDEIDGAAGKAAAISEDEAKTAADGDTEAAGSEARA
ncbi:Helix-hairpin-helix domain-containing protein [Promicromonospora umidemergens]|uniref:Helix-hairpin-helix DNA-binding motif class 1 domain-containing protein n=1 Tax=Promicromonospora umidemergens TaxID=629679 RepID=A0ABP8X7N4_9MICO|nr:helix-hairpin-helix domain-containing protein [Promicromonospora umidemergens]MCP2281335.1 Helix-hairpin-helix domain-containing protein [Promicromonospora umidemergens]